MSDDQQLPNDADPWAGYAAPITNPWADKAVPATSFKAAAQKASAHLKEKQQLKDQIHAQELAEERETLRMQRETLRMQREAMEDKLAAQRLQRQAEREDAEHKEAMRKAAIQAAKDEQKHAEELKAKEFQKQKSKKTVGIVASFAKNTLMLSGAAFIMFMLYKVATDFDRFFPEHKDNPNGGVPTQDHAQQPPVTDPTLPPGQGTGKATPNSGETSQGNPQDGTQGGSNETPAGGSGAQEPKTFPEPVRDFSEYAPPADAGKHIGEGEGKKGENPDEWGWGVYYEGYVPPRMPERTPQ